MKKRFTFLIAALMLLTMISQPTRLWGQSTTYTSNVTLPTSGTNVYSCSVSISSNTYSAVRLGKSNTTGSGSITVPAGTVKLYVHCAGWSNETGNLTLSTSASGVTITPTTMSLTADSGISGSGNTFTLNATNASTSYFQEFTLSGVTTSTTITMTSPNKKRCVVWGVNYVIGHTLTYSATNGSISGVDAGSNAVASGASIAEGATVTLTATPASGYSFTSWEVSGTGSTLSSTNTSPTTFTMGTANATVTANFSAASGYINVSPTTATPSCAAQNVAFSVDTDQTLDENPVVFYTNSTGDVTASKPSWIGDLTSAYSSSTLTIPVAANTGAARTAYFRVEKGSVKSDVITINQAVYAPSAPTLPAAGNFDYTKEITITVPSGTTVYYTLDGTDPTSSSTAYSAPFTINDTKTVKAVAYEGSYPSAVVSATYTRTYKYINEITAANYYTVKGTVVAVNGTSGFVLGDGTGYIYCYMSHSKSVGDLVAITDGHVKNYNHVWEFENGTLSVAASSAYTTGTPAITAWTEEIFNSYSGSGVANLGTYFEVVGTYAKTNKEITITGTTKKVRLSSSNTYNSLDGKTVKARGYFAGMNTSGTTPTAMFICPESVEAVPVVTTSVTAISNFTYNVGGGPNVKSFTVSGANLTGDLTVTASTNYKVCKTSDGEYTSSISFEPTTGTVAATAVYVRLEAGLSSNTYEGTVTVASDGATSKVVALTGTVKHTITNDPSIENGAVNSDPSEAALAGATVTLTAEPAVNYKLGSFTVTKAGSGTVDVTLTGANTGTFTMPADNVTVSATFTPAYTVTYVANGGSGTMTDANSPYIEGAQVTLLDNSYTYAGHTWSSWLVKNVSTDETITPVEGKFTMPASAVTVTAQWNLTSYAVTLSSVDNVTLSGTYGAEGTIAETQTQSIPYDTEITLSATGLASGKTFVWSVTKNEDSSDVTNYVLDGDILTVPAYAITIGGAIDDIKAIYAITSSTEVTESGTRPKGSSATFSQPYGTTCQLVSGNSMTLTLKGYQNQIIKKIVLEMASNTSKGAGSLSMIAGTTTLKTISDSKFNTANWYGSWSTSYVDVEKTMDNATYEIKSDEDVVITITSSENSLYCDKFTIYYETTTTPVINAENVNLVYTATSGEIPYTITNPSGASLSAVETTGDWISGVTVDGANSKVTFTTTTNSGVGREGTITLSYTGASDKVVRVYQEAQKFTVTYAAGTGGSGTMTDSNSPYEYGAEVTLLTNTFTAPSGKMFNGWVVTDGSSHPVAVTNGKFTMPNSDVTVTAQWRDKDKYQLVNSTAGLVAGKHYIIASGTSGTAYAMGCQNTNNRPKSDVVTFDEGKIVEAADIWDFVLSGDGTNGWTFYDKYTDGEGFLYAASNTENHLKLQTTLDDNGKWTIDFSDDAVNIVAKGSNSHKYMRYNTSGLFSCYEKGKQSAIYLFVKYNDDDYEIYSPTPIEGDQTISTLIVESTLTIADGTTLEVTDELVNDDPANLIIEEGGQLIIPNNATVAATFIKNVPEKTSKDVKVTGWKLISSPTTTPGQAYENFDDVNNLEDEDGYLLYKYDEEYRMWRSSQTTNHTYNTLNVGQGYLYGNNSGTAIEFTGNVNSAASYSIDLSYNEKYSDNLAGFNLIGNPFSHEIDWSNGVTLTGESISNGYYKIDGEGFSASLCTENIAPLQGILVKANATGQSVTFNNVMPGAKGEKANHDNIMFKVENSEYSDVAYALFDKGYGLNKINHRGDMVPMLYIPQNGENYAIAMMDDNTNSFNLNFEAKTTGNYTLSFKTNGEFNYLHVIDRLTGEDIDMLVEGEYSFVGSPRDNANRFIVRLGYLPNYSDNGEDIFAYQNGNDIVVSGEGELQIFDVMGRMVSSQRINGVETMCTSSLQNGVYVFRLNEKTQKIVVR